MRIDLESKLSFETVSSIVYSGFWERTPQGKIDMEYTAQLIAKDLQMPEKADLIITAIYDSVSSINLEHPMLTEATDFIHKALTTKENNHLIFFSVGDPEMQTRKMDLILTLAQAKFNLPTDRIFYSFDDTDKLRNLPKLLKEIHPSSQALVIDDNEEVIKQAQKLQAQTWFKNNQSPLGSLSRLKLDPQTQYTILLDIDNTTYPEDLERIPKMIAKIYSLLQAPSTR